MGIKSLFKAQNEKAAAKAAFDGNFEQAFALIDKGLNINFTRWVEGKGFDDRGGEGNIGYAAIKHGNLEALEKALEKGLDPSLQSRYLSPLVVFAIHQKQEEAALTLVERGADLTSYLFAECLSPLSLAKMYGMNKLTQAIESKLTSEQLDAARAADIFPDAPKAPAPAKQLKL
jgi:hypothetical protein